MALFLLIGTLFSENHPDQSRGTITERFSARVIDFLFLSLFFRFDPFLLFGVLYFHGFLSLNLRPQIILKFNCFANLALYPAKLRGDHSSKSLCRKISIIPALERSVRKSKESFSLSCHSIRSYILIFDTVKSFNGSQNMEAFARYGGDEFVIYPILMEYHETRGQTFSATLYHLFIL